MSEQKDLLNGAADLRGLADQMQALCLRQRIVELQCIYGSCRKVGKALNIDHSYLARLRDGKKTDPSSAVLRKLGLN